MTPEQSYREIPLTKGQTAIVDTKWHSELTQRKWHAFWNKGTSSYYAIRCVRFGPRKEGKKRIIFMHRQILGLIHGDGKQGDHRNGNTLDNREDNLRVTNYDGNAKNRKVRKDSSSRLKGVWFHKRCKKWTAQIYCNGKKIHLGLHQTAEEAKSAYDAEAQRLQGEFATNR